ncbi:hypothetical protein PILCRDRAFT_10947 [Piloderma croceum F 1598]|uniref:Uncharacterized protein n=1 Tax=Piloderma croceum (strain F 1598) TaxID=765440 RepID=A0A0C3FFZ4_PILCF|nr:hypothetical protein PILCRDRAFT_10947 [Piloderma croceum F 1598]
MDTEKEDDEYNLDEEDNLLDNEVVWLASLINEAAAPEGEEIDELEMDYNPRDLLGKVLTLINQSLL